MLRLNLLLLLSFGVLQSYGQRELWKRYRHEFSAGIGIANCLTDLGGGEGDGGYIKDFHLRMTRPALTAAYRLKITERIAFKSSISYLWIQGSDELSKNEGRKLRNLNFRTNIYELGLQFEYYIIKEPVGKLNTVNAIRYGQKSKEIGVYVLAGAAPFLFSPLGEAENGTWYRLRPLGTEGQGQPGGPAEYGTFGVALLTGAGVKFVVHRQLSFGIEGAMRFTSTDYLDDVSTTYYDFSQEGVEVNGLTTSLADQRLTGSQGSPGGIRGNPENSDVYMGLIFSVNYKLAPDQKLSFSRKKKRKRVKL